MQWNRRVRGGEMGGDGSARRDFFLQAYCKSHNRCLSYLKPPLMNRLLVLCIAPLLLFGLYTANTAAPHTTYPASAKTEDLVYICYSNTSYAFHSSPNCRGLNRCTHKIIKVSKKDAVASYGKRACKLCE